MLGVLVCLEFRYGCRWLMVDTLCGRFTYSGSLFQFCQDSAMLKNPPGDSPPAISSSFFILMVARTPPAAGHAGHAASSLRWGSGGELNLWAAGRGLSPPSLGSRSTGGATGQLPTSRPAWMKCHQKISPKFCIR